jgi:hypothetical protein
MDKIEEEKSGDEWEETHMVVTLSDFKDAKFLRESQTIRITDYLTRPLLNADGFEFLGEHQNSVGSLLLLGPDESSNAILCNKKTDFRLIKIPLPASSESRIDENPTVQNKNADHMG